MKKLIPLFALLLLVSVCGLLSCKTEDAENVNQDRIKTNYVLTYNEGERMTTASAIFSFGSTNLELNSPSSIAFNGTRLTKSRFLGLVTYDRQFSGLISNGDFEYTNNDEELFVNKVSMISPISIPVSFQTVYTTSTNRLFWDGNPLASQESVTVTIQNDQVSFVKSFDAVNAREIQFEGTELPLGLMGQCTITISRIFETNNLNTPEAGGTLRVEWISETFAINVVE